MSPKHFNASGIADLDVRPAITWARAGKDQVISDASMFDFGTLGRIGAVPGWPGEEVLPPQPMDVQIRAVLDRYAANGGTVREVGLEEWPTASRSRRRRPSLRRSWRTFTGEPAAGHRVARLPGIRDLRRAGEPTA